MRINKKSKAIALAASVTLLALTSLSPSQAYDGTIKSGNACEMSGEVANTKTSTFVCLNTTAGKVWSKAFPLAKKAKTAKLDVSMSWLKAGDMMLNEMKMTGSFGVISNSSSKAIRVIGGYTSVAGAVQMHEMIMKDGAMVMSEKLNGFTIPANGSFALKPGGNHVMFMDLKQDMKPGKLYTITLITSTGERVTYKAIGRIFNGANESYDPGTGDSLNPTTGHAPAGSMGSGSSTGMSDGASTGMGSTPGAGSTHSNP